MTTPSHDIEALAKKAIEDRQAFIETDFPEQSIGQSMLFAAGVQSNSAYHSAATPEAWLTLSQKNRELEQALAEALEALKPFAEEAKRWADSVSELVNVAEGDPDITIGDLRRAARALNTHPDTMNDTTKNPIAAPASPTSKGA